MIDSSEDVPEGCEIRACNSAKKEMGWRKHTVTKQKAGGEPVLLWVDHGC